VETTAPRSTSLTRFAWLSIAAALITIALKAAAWHFTGSVGLLSDAMESVVNLIGAVMALAMLTVAARPADETHAYGHYKAEYFSSGMEGAMILLAAASIGLAAAKRLIAPAPLENVGLGVAVSMVAALVNLLVALVLRRAGRAHESVTLEADSNHLFTDVLTTGGVVLGIGLVVLTGWQRLDPIIGLAVALVIVLTGVRIVRKSVYGLMDTALPASEQDAVRSVFERFAAEDDIQFHALRTRQSGVRRFVSVHVLVPGAWTVQRGHDLLEHIEADVRDTLPNVSIFTHLESLDDPASYDDVTLERPRAERRERDRRSSE
jgi:cation diffusion facilitator family transporter